MSGRTAVHVTIELRVHGVEPDEEFHDRVEALMDELVAIEQRDVDLSDGTVSGDPGARRITIELLVLTDDPVYALARSISATSAAVDSVGARVPFTLDHANARTEPALVAA
jgi:hypothetical protein